MCRPLLFAKQGAQLLNLAGAAAALGTSTAVMAAEPQSTPWSFSTFLDAVESNLIEKVSFSADGKCRHSVRSVINGYSPLMPGNVRLKRFAPALLMPTKGASILVNSLTSRAAVLRSGFAQRIWLRERLEAAVTRLATATTESP